MGVRHGYEASNKHTLLITRQARGDPGRPTMTMANRYWARLPEMWAAISPRATSTPQSAIAHATGSHGHTPACAPISAHKRRLATSLASHRPALALLLMRLP